MIITAQMIRDRLAFEGPMSLWSLEESLGIKDSETASLMVDAVHCAEERGYVKAKIVKIEEQEHVIFYTNWEE